MMKTSLTVASLLVLNLALPGAAQNPPTTGLPGQIAPLTAEQKGSVKKTTAGPCFDNTNRYVNCGNGTVTDSVTGLIWLQQADCLGNADYAAANQAAAGLKDGDCNLTDGSSPGDWRLPTVDEWNAATARAVIYGCTVQNGLSPTLTDDSGFGCLSVGPSSFAGVASFKYWSSSTIEGNPTSAVFVRLLDGEDSSDAKFMSHAVWPVRGGPR